MAANVNIIDDFTKNKRQSEKYFLLANIWHEGTFNGIFELICKFIYRLFMFIRRFNYANQIELLNNTAAIEKTVLLTSSILTKLEGTPKEISLGISGCIISN